MRILSDQDIDRVPLNVLNDAISAHIVADAAGDASSPPRHIVDISRGAVSLSVGGRNGYAGFRASETFHSPDAEHEEQIVAGWDTTTGNLFGIAVGDRLGAIRTGCIGGIALDVMAPREVKTLALIGTGKLAESQLAAAIALRQFQQIRIYGRQPVAATELAKVYRQKTQTPIQISSTPEEAVHNADIVILASASATEPVISTDWVAPHAHITTIGPKTKTRHELPIGLVHRAKIIASDSPQQILASPTHFLQGEQSAKRIKHLGGLIGKFNPDKDRGITLFLSSGLAGTEVAALKAAVGFLSTS